MCALVHTKTLLNLSTHNTTKYGYESRGARQVHSNTNQDKTLFPKEKGAALGVGLEPTTLLTLPTELPGQAGL